MRGLDHVLDHLVVVIWIMMKEEEFADLGIDGEGHSAAERAVSPSDFRGIFVVGVLRIDDEDVGAMKKLHQLGAGIGCEGARFGVRLSLAEF